jgi:predicted transcriptional regulator
MENDVDYTNDIENTITIQLDPDTMDSISDICMILNTDAETYIKQCINHYQEFHIDETLNFIEAIRDNPVNYPSIDE